MDRTPIPRSYNTVARLRRKDRSLIVAQMFCFHKGVINVLRFLINGQHLAISC